MEGFLCFGKIKPDCTTRSDGSFLRRHLRLTASKLGQAIFLGTRSLCDLAFFPGNLGPLPAHDDYSRCRRWLEVLEAAGESGHAVWTAQAPQTPISGDTADRGSFSSWVLPNNLKNHASSMNLTFWANSKVWKYFEPLGFVCLPYWGLQNSVHGLKVWRLNSRKNVAWWWPFGPSLT